mmetsp:Transcript_4482/g.6015  ORF Transcript_4482/g.6015 Transcript_4482/m.6015 type:complete len:89 (-) Transcript_4482:519-785(-)
MKMNGDTAVLILFLEVEEIIMDIFFHSLSPVIQAAILIRNNPRMKIKEVGDRDSMRHIGRMRKLLANKTQIQLDVREFMKPTRYNLHR